MRISRSFTSPTLAAAWAFLYLEFVLATPCRAPRCPNLTTRKDKGYCDEHKDRRTNWAKHQRRHGNTTQRGYGHVWRKLRTQILQRDDYLCVSCRAAGRLVPATDVDHIVPKSQGGTDTPDNLQSLCKPCHRRKTATENKIGYFMPEYLKPIPQSVIVFGPPASGKTTWAVKNTPNAFIVDLDLIVQKMTGKPKYIKTEEERLLGINKRNQIMMELAASGEPCTIVLTGSTVEQRIWWVDKLKPKQVVQLRESASVLIERIHADTSRPSSVKKRHLEVVRCYEYD